MNKESKIKQSKAKQIISSHYLVNRNHIPLKRGRKEKAVKAGRITDDQSPAIFIQHIQDLLVSPTSGSLDKRQNATSRVKISSIFG